MKDEMRERLRRCIYGTIEDMGTQERLKPGSKADLTSFAMKHISPLVEDLAAKLEAAQANTFDEFGEAVLLSQIDDLTKKLEAAEKGAANRARAVTVDWDKTNARRVTLIRKEIAGKSSMEENQELDRLQALADFRIEIFAPLTGIAEMGEKHEYT